jgi:hypothetical protein
VNLKILNVNARYPGSAHDSYILTNSNVEPMLRRLHSRGEDNSYLLGDSGYPLRSWLMTPLHTVEPNSPEERFNTKFTTVRATVERCIGVLKMRFRCLLKHRVLHYAPKKASLIINACVVLHNLCIESNMPEPDPIDETLDFGDVNNEFIYVEEPPRNRRTNPDLIAGQRVQSTRIRNYFSRHNT